MNKKTLWNKAKQKLEKGFYGFRVRKRRFTFLIMGLIIAAGIFSLYIIPKESSPDISFGMISINTVYQWVNPQDIDNLITDKIESAVKDIDWVKKVSSVSAVGFSNTMIELENDADITQALVDAKDAVDKVDLPREAEDPMVTEISTDNELMFMVLLYGDEDIYGPLYLLEKARKIKADLDGNGSINRVDIGGTTQGWGDVKIGWAGESNYDIQVLLNKNKVESLNLNLFQISQAIRNRNQNQPLWNHQISELSYDFRIQWELKNIAELGMIPIQTQKWFVYLKDIATIQKKLKDESIRKLWSFQISGQNYISLSINKSAWKNIFASAQEAKQLLNDELKKIGYKGLHYAIMYDMADNINDDYSKLAKNGLQTLVLVFLSLLLFVGLKESIIATITLPLAFFITFIVLQKLGLSLNFLTNFSLIITFGIAIDTTIVVIEWAHERIRQWFRSKHAILLSVRDYKLPLMAWTATTVVVFLPLLTLPGLVGKFLAFIPITIFVTLLAALLISLTINSALYYKLSKPRKYFEDKLIDRKYIREGDAIMLREDRKNKVEKPEKHKWFRERVLDKISMRYAKLLWKIIGNAKTRLWAIAVSVGLFLFGMLIIAPSLWFNIFPNSDKGWMNIDITAEKGTNKEVLATYTDNIETVLSEIPEIKVYDYTIGSNQIAISIELLKQTERKRQGMKSIFEVEKEINEELDFLRSEWLKVDISVVKNWPPSGTAVGVKLVADNNDKFNQLLLVAKDFKDHLDSLPWSKNASISSEESPWQFVYNLKKEKLSLLGVAPAEFFPELYAVSNGIGAGSLKWEYDDHDIKLKYAEFENGVSPNQFNDLNVQTRAGPLRVGDIADYHFEQAISQITREDTKVTITVGSSVEEDIPASKLQAELMQYAESYNYPDGISFELWGEKEANADLIQALLSAFIIALLFIFGILVLQFNSYMQPIIIMSSILLWLVGATIGLKLTWNVYSLMFMIWFIALTWIVVNDAIVFLDRANQNIKRWMDELSAIVETWKARLHPILLTTITTILWLSSILSDSMWQPLAVTIMFGIFFGSSMTLFVIPAIYYDRKKFSYLIKRTIINQILSNSIFVGWFGGILAILYFFGIKVGGTSWLGLVAGITFVLYHIAYFIYNTHAQSETGQWIVWKMLWLKITDKDGNMLSKKKLTQRYLIKKTLLFGPVLIWWLIYLLLSKFAPEVAPKTAWGLVAIAYVAIISRYFYQFQTSKDNQTLHDKFVWAYVSESIPLKN